MQHNFYFKLISVQNNCTYSFSYFNITILLLLIELSFNCSVSPHNAIQNTINVEFKLFKRTTEHENLRSN